MSYNASKVKECLGLPKEAVYLFNQHGARLDATAIRDSDIICVSRSPDFSPDSVSRWNSPLAIDSTDNSIEEKRGPFDSRFPANVVHTSHSGNFNLDPSSDKEDVSFEDYRTVNNHNGIAVSTTSSSPRSDSSLPEWVRLDVGGKKFVTTRTTLTKESDSMLAKMFSGHWNSARDEKVWRTFSINEI